MSDGGGGGGGGGGGDKGGGGGGDKGSSADTGNPLSNTSTDGATYSPPSSAASSPFESSGSSPLGFADLTPGSSGTSSGEQSGFQGSGLPSEISTGSSPSSVVGNSDWWSTPDIATYAPNGFNLAGPGPVGGDSGLPGAASGTSASLGASASDTTGGTSAAAFAAPSGISGTPDLSSLVSDPNSGSSGAATDSGSQQGIWDSLNGAENSQANAYGTGAAGAVPTAAGESTATTLPATTASTGSGSGSSTGSGSGSSSGLGLNTNTAGVALAGAGLLNNLVNGNQTSPAASQLGLNAAQAQALAAQYAQQGSAMGSQYGTPALQSGQSQTAQGQALQQYVATGTLPQGYEDQVQQSVQQQKAQIISNYAQRGLPTDPTMNSMLAQELGQVDQKIPAMREQLAAQLASTGNSIIASGNSTSTTGANLTANGLINDGLTASGISSGAYTTLANLTNDQNKQRAAAIANFAASLNGGAKNNGGINLNIGGTKAA